MCLAPVILGEGALTWTFRSVAQTGQSSSAQGFNPVSANLLCQMPARTFPVRLLGERYSGRAEIPGAGRVRLRPNRGFPRGSARQRNPSIISRLDYYAPPRAKAWRIFLSFDVKWRCTSCSSRTTDHWGVTPHAEGNTESPGSGGASPYLRRGSRTYDTRRSWDSTLGTTRRATRPEAEGLEVGMRSGSQVWEPIAAVPADN
jgi:hypothetical protein